MPNLSDASCPHCGCNNIVGEQGESVCSACGIMLAIDNLDDRADQGTTTYIVERVFGKKLRAKASHKETQTSKAKAMVQGFCNALNLSAYAEQVKHKFEQIIAHGHFRWGVSTPGVAAVAIYVVARENKLLLPVHQIATVCGINLPTMTRYQKRTLPLVQAMGIESKSSPEADVILQVDRFIEDILLAPPEAQITLPTSYEKSIKNVTRTVLAITVPTLLEGRHGDSFALAVVFLAIESLIRHRISLVPFTRYLQVTHATTSLRVREMHDIFTDMSRKLPWGDVVTRLNLGWFLGGMLQMIENGVRIPGVQISPSFLAAELERQDISERVRRAVTRLNRDRPRSSLNHNGSTLTVLPTTTTTFTQSVNLDDIDLAIERLLMHGIRAQQVASLAIAQLMSEAERISQDLTGRRNGVHLNNLRDEVLLTQKEEAEYIMTNENELQNRQRVLIAAGQFHWPTSNDIETKLADGQRLTRKRRRSDLLLPVSNDNILTVSDQQKPVKKKTTGSLSRKINMVVMQQVNEEFQEITPDDFNISDFDE